MTKKIRLPQPPSQGQSGAQHVVDTGLPAVPSGPKGSEHVRVQAQLHWLLGHLATLPAGRPRRRFTVCSGV